MKSLLGAVVAVLVVGAVGCGGGSLCDKDADAAKRCGFVVNVASCEQGVSNCNDNDKAIADSFLDCVSQDDVCKDGRVINASAYNACRAAATGVSEACRENL